MAQEEIQNQDRHLFASNKTRKQIFTDNFIGGLSWGIGSILGATIIVGVFGILITRSRNIPLIGDVVQVVIDEINQGRNVDLFGTKSNTTTNTNNDTNYVLPSVSYPTN